ncbi:hypothetical protein DY000_02010515 [Brassica cretica]|uniref:Uncharacterized protein n=1 Tax=Brassica cretica TaxID=69181 RepID=A0ABQ7CBL8_BRACR|nr:hypothetical protein DY000_02010515 [Brassica cretica]
MSGGEVCGHSMCGWVLCGWAMRCGQKSCKVVERCKEGSGMGIKNGRMPFRVMSGWEVCDHSMCGRVLCGQTMRCGQTSCEVVVERVC